MLISQLITREPLISESKRPALRQLLGRLAAKLLEPQHSQFDLFKVCVIAVGPQLGGKLQGVNLPGVFLVQCSAACNLLRQASAHLMCNVCASVVCACNRT